jgi:hypothetical protein
MALRWGVAVLGARRFSTAAVVPEGAAAVKGKAAGFMSKIPRHPDYEGAEAIMRFYMPHNYQVSR